MESGNVARRRSSHAHVCSEQEGDACRDDAQGCAAGRQRAVRRDAGGTAAAVILEVRGWRLEAGRSPRTQAAVGTFETGPARSWTTKELCDAKLVLGLDRRPDCGTWLFTDHARPRR